jgi:hypothetical protein
VSVRRPQLRRSSQRRERGRRRIAASIAAGVLLETVALWLRSGRIGGNVIVRCRRGHLFTTIWIPAVSVKSLRFGWWRAQHCPVGHHWTVVTPVKQADLSEERRRSAAEHHDIRIP